MKTFLFSLAFIFITMPAFATEGGTVGNGDEPSLEMPKENFSFTCKVYLRGSNPNSNFYSAHRSFEIKKEDFKMNGNPKAGVPPSSAGASLTYGRNGWILEDIDGSSPTQLPIFLIDQAVALSLSPGGGGVQIGVCVAPKINGKEMTANACSHDINFRSKKKFGVNIDLRIEGFIRQISVECERAS